MVQTGGGVAFFAHIGGFVVGAVMAKAAIAIGRRMGRSADPQAVG
jgi:membrane associated rhomboid family serine protease